MSCRATAVGGYAEYGVDYAVGEPSHHGLQWSWEEGDDIEQHVARKEVLDCLLAEDGIERVDQSGRECVKQCLCAAAKGRAVIGCCQVDHLSHTVIGIVRQIIFDQ